MTAFADRFNELADDSAAAFEPFTDDARILDPSNADFEIGPKSVIVTSWQGWMTAVDAYDAATTGIYVSRSAAVVLTDVAVVWPPSGPAFSEPLTHEARIFRFAGVPAADVTTFELWYALEGMAAGEGTCFELHDCGPALQAFIQRYVAAWSGSDTTLIAGLYAPGASFLDSVLAIEATGPDAIAAVDGARFGGAPPRSCSVEGTYVITNDGDPAYADWDDPDGGKVAGVVLLTSCLLEQERTLDGAVILMLGTWTPEGYDLDPDGRIVREEVFYDAASLVAAGLVR